MAMVNGGKYTVNTLFEDAYEDERVVEIIRNTCPSVFSNPRFNEIFEFSLKEIVKMDLTAVAGVTKSQLKQMLKQIIALE